MSSAVALIRTPAVKRVFRRLDFYVDGRADAVLRGVNPVGQDRVWRGERWKAVGIALRWRARGYPGVEILTGDSDWLDFPASREEALEAVREQAAQDCVGAGRWRSFLRSIERLEKA